MGRIQKETATLRRVQTKTAPVAKTYRGFRQLEWNEVVYHGDYVADEHSVLKLWEGLSGFRAGSFVQFIYRKETPLGMEEPVLRNNGRNTKQR
jgi:hypothetical protein